MSKALESALTAVTYSRCARSTRAFQQQTAIDARQSYLLAYAGTQNGIQKGATPNGGTVPVTPLSNGSIELGTPFIALGAGTLYANWMPQ